MLLGLDREVEKLINAKQKEHNCIIIISDNGVMDIMYLFTGKSKQVSVRLGNKSQLMIDIRQAFR